MDGPRYKPAWFQLILLSRLGGPDFALNPDLIERAEATPDTVVTLVSGNKYVVRQSIEELIELIAMNRARVLAAAEHLNEADSQPVETVTRAHRVAHAGRDSVVALYPTEG